MSDLYDGFLSAEDRSGVKMPDRVVVPPMVKWGNPADGPYTWPFDATQTFGVRNAIVSMPPAHARAGLMGWSALGHECCGHDVLHANVGLQGEMSKKVRAALNTDALKDTVLPGYWAECIDETSSDVMGILNIGPAAGIGLIAYFRGFGGPTGLLSAVGPDPDDDPHPADILRGYLAASVVRLLSFTGRDVWAKRIEDETDKDLQASGGTLTIMDTEVSVKLAKQSAAIVAEQIAKTPSAI